MPYLMRKLIINEFVLRNNFRIIRKYLDSFDEGEACLSNFSIYGDDMSIRLRAEYRDDAIKKKARGVLDQLVADNDIIRYEPDNWVSKEEVSSITRRACNLAFQCASVLSNLNEFEHISQTNMIHHAFLPCFLYRLFQSIDVDLNFDPDNVEQSEIRFNLQNMVSNSITAVASTIILNKNDFSTDGFFERFIHLLANNLLIPQPVEASSFWQIFWNRNKQGTEILEQTIQRFCEELDP